MATGDENRIALEEVKRNDDTWKNKEASSSQNNMVMVELFQRYGESYILLP